MIALLKNIAFRCWSAGSLALVISLWLLPHSGATVSLITSLMVFGLLFAALFAVVGALSDLFVRRQLQPLLQEAGMLERGGLGLEAEQTFERALALLDSFMVSPWRRRQYLRALGARMARFYAAQAEKNDRAYKWITRYLGVFPGDRAIAEVWLQDMENLGVWRKAQQDLAARIGATRHDDPQIQMALARIYIRAGRTDFPALQTYRRVMEPPEHLPDGMLIDLARCFIKEGRADETALKAYVQASRRESPPEDLRCGLAACLRWIEPTERTQTLIARARTILGPLEADVLERMSTGFLPPTGRHEPMTDRPRIADTGRPWWAGVGQRIRAGIDRLGPTMKRLAAPFKSPRIRALVKTGIIGGLALAAIALLFNTAGHLVPPSTPPVTPPGEIAVDVPPEPYTLQVAAYLQPAHAERYIQSLKDKGQDAYRVEAQSHQKTWYQVRVGHFPSKAAARAHGQQLKADGVIEDFYVANYEAP
jgi:hypothetical protein